MIRVDSSASTIDPGSRAAKRQASRLSDTKRNYPARVIQDIDDLALHIVRLDYGPEVANKVARRMVTAPHRDGGQSQFAFTPVPVSGFGDAIGAVMDWMFEHVDEPMTVHQLARLAAMSGDHVDRQRRRREQILRTQDPLVRQPP